MRVASHDVLTTFRFIDFDYTRHTSSCLCVGRPYSPQSLTYVSSWGLAQLPRYKAMRPCPKGPTQSVVQNAHVLSRNSNYLGYTP
ncbi:hypothetical protein BVY05_02485 [Pectobacterium odoriferum]|nr:hypothetical protein BV925_02700 [Pectobacterium odoriferum]POE04231.1 hypothetical protein BVY05_02485 [Pectobacterium odoriferum]POE06137.1 hypothetical protein BV916_05765 [Pectobacterium odoriferum]